MALTVRWHARCSAKHHRGRTARQVAAIAQNHSDADAASVGLVETPAPFAFGAQSWQFWLIVTEPASHIDPRHHDFITLVMRVRMVHGASIDEAHRIIFADPAMRRLTAARINRDAQCRKLANADIRTKGEKSLLVREGNRIRFR
ncbi:MAG: hypothetical protein KGM18_07025 [Sphingomonadales bacterium]|nr:hypothetical protein [Sphingomonadales bacterium]